MNNKCEHANCDNPRFTTVNGVGLCASHLDDLLPTCSVFGCVEKAVGKQNNLLYCKTHLKPHIFSEKDFINVLQLAIDNKATPEQMERAKKYAQAKINAYANELLLASEDDPFTFDGHSHLNSIHGDLDRMLYRLGQFRGAIVKNSHD